MAAKKATKGTTKTRKSRKRQGEIPGTEREVDEDLEVAMAIAHDLTEKRKALQGDEKTARKKVMSLCRERGIEVYYSAELGKRLDYSCSEKETVEIKEWVPPTAAPDAAE